MGFSGSKTRILTYNSCPVVTALSNNAKRTGEYYDADDVLTSFDTMLSGVESR